MYNFPQNHWCMANKICKGALGLTFFGVDFNLTPHPFTKEIVLIESAFKKYFSYIFSTYFLFFAVVLERVVIQSACFLLLMTLAFWLGLNHLMFSSACIQLILGLIWYWMLKAHIWYIALLYMHPLVWNDHNDQVDSYTQLLTVTTLCMHASI